MKLSTTVTENVDYIKTVC